MKHVIVAYGAGQSIPRVVVALDSEELARIRADQLTDLAFALEMNDREPRRNIDTAPDPLCIAGVRYGVHPCPEEYEQPLEDNRPTVWWALHPTDRPKHVLDLDTLPTEVNRLQDTPERRGLSGEMRFGRSRSGWEIQGTGPAFAALQTADLCELRSAHITGLARVEQIDVRETMLSASAGGRSFRVRFFEHTPRPPPFSDYGRRFMEVQEAESSIAEDDEGIAEDYEQRLFRLVMESENPQATLDEIRAQVRNLPDYFNGRDV